MSNEPDGKILTLGETLQRAAYYLKRHGVESPRLDAELLLSHVLGVERIALYTDSQRPLTVAERAQLRDPIRRRGEREPVAHIIGRRPFRRLDLTVNSDVLVPRPETEVLVEWAVDVLPDRARVVDWGTGSGAIAIALATERRDLRVVALDRSEAALEVARQNALDAGAQVHFLHSDGLAELGEHRVEAIVANPPYLSEAQYADAPAELAHEPREALVGGPKGDEVVNDIITAAVDHLLPEGWLMIEVGEGQARDALARMDKAGFKESDLRHDLAGIERVIGGHL